MVLGNPHSQTLGASGAIFGLMGALVVLALKVGGQIQTVLVWIGLNLVFTFTISGISWQGHVGGLVGGVVLGAVIVYAPRERRSLVQWSATAAVLVVVAGRGGAALRRPDVTGRPEKLSTPGDNPVENYTRVSGEHGHGPAHSHLVAKVKPTAMKPIPTSRLYCPRSPITGTDSLLLTK